MSSESILAETKLTPMMEQYQAIHKTLPQNTILFFRLGDFYEMFFDHAVRAAEILNITLTGRDAGEAGRVPMCGIPYHSYQGYVKTLLNRNLKVAICEQMGDPKAGRGLVERKITRILTPATNLEDEEKNHRPDYLVSISADADEMALACLELSTGEFRIQATHRERLLGDLSILSPREIVVSKKYSSGESWMETVRETLNAGITVYDDWIFDEKEGRRLILESFKLSSDRQIPFIHKPAGVSAVGAVLYYLRDHLHHSLEHLSVPQFAEDRDFMVLDRQTQKSLELVSNMRNEREGISLLTVLDQTVTAMGSRTLNFWITHPLIHKKLIDERLSGVQEFVQSPDRLLSIRENLKGIRDMERTIGRLNCGVANARDLVNLKFFITRAPVLRGLINASKNPLIQYLSASLKDFPQIEEKISLSIVDEPPLSLKDGGMIRDGYSRELDELRKISRHGKVWLLDFEKREIERTGIRSLKVKYSQVFGYTIDISKANLHLVPADYIRRQTLANAERFILPELKEWDEKISSASDKIKMLEYQLFNEVRMEILKQLTPLQQMAHAIGDLDALLSLSLIAHQKKWVRPEIHEDEKLEIQAGRHPVVESMMSSGQFIENDTEMNGGSDQLIVLTGPNMAGKSTYIRQIAQLVLLAQIGSFLPAKSARIGLVDRIFTRIGASDDLSRGESTFMVEMLETAHILRSATDKSLLILDEVGRGTSTFDGVSIAWAVCEYLAGNKIHPRTLFATHYHELTQLEDHFPRIKNYHITVRETPEGILFLRKVVRGGADRSYGIHVAKLAGLPDEIIKRAGCILEVLENENVEATNLLESSTQKRKSKASDLNQPSLFDLKSGTTRSADNAPHPILKEIESAVTQEMTPIEALIKIDEWKKKLKKDL